MRIYNDRMGNKKLIITAVLIFSILSNLLAGLYIFGLHEVIEEDKNALLTANSLCENYNKELTSMYNDLMDLKNLAADYIAGKVDKNVDIISEADRINERLKQGQLKIDDINQRHSQVLREYNE